MDFAWQGGKDGHIVTCERLADGSLRTYDPQTGNLHTLKYYLDNIQTARGILIVRVDNLLIATGKYDTTPKPLTQLLKKSGTPTPRATKQAVKSGGIAGAPNNPLSEVAKQRRKEIRQQARTLTKNTITHNDLKGKTIGVSNHSIKEWLNQPHAQYEQKNELLLKIWDELPKMEYKGFALGKKNVKIKVHLFETNVAGVSSWVLVKENPNGDIWLFSISDQRSILDLIVQ